MSRRLALIVEDDRDLAIIFAEALHAADYETEIARRGNEALACLASMTPEIVILDLHLPRVSGADILRQIRSEERLMETRVIIVTADPREAETLYEGADLTLIKPIDFGQLRDLAKRLATGGVVDGQ
ncbi:MAG: response regulator [Anaerolineae bacterium]|jgi:DNA-binding response OmpR family regulator